jgi:hypothetical protein
MPLHPALFQQFVRMETLLRLNWLTSKKRSGAEIEAASDANSETRKNVIPDHLKAEFENSNTMRELKVKFVVEDDYDIDFGEHISRLSNVPMWFYYMMYLSYI